MSTDERLKHFEAECMDLRQRSDAMYMQLIRQIAMMDGLAKAHDQLMLENRELRRQNDELSQEVQALKSGVVFIKDAKRSTNHT